MTPRIEGPEIEFPAHEFRTIVEPDRLWAADLSEHPFEHSNDIGAAELLPHFHRWRQPSEGVDNSQNADLAAVEQLVNCAPPKPQRQ